MTKFKKSLLILVALTLVVCAALGTFIALSLTDSLKSEPIALEFTIGNLTREYNGEPQKARKEDKDCQKLVKLTGGYLIEGHTLDVEFTGEQTDVGYCLIGLDVKAVDAAGFDVTDEYKIKVNRGILNVTPRAVNVKLTGKRVIYDGNVVDVGKEYTSSGLVKGHDVKLKISDEWLSGTGKSLAGKTLDSRYISAMIVDAVGNDVTKNYSIGLTGSVSVEPRPLIVTPLGAEKTYDGKPLKCSGYKIESGALADGHYIAYYETTSEYGESEQLNAGSLDIRMSSVVIKDIYGDEVTDNYAISYGTGTITVNKAPLTIVAKSESWVYDGTLHSTTSSLPESVAGLVNGEKVTVEYDPDSAIKNVNTTPNKIIAYHIDDDNGNDNYFVTLTEGKLEVTKAPVTIRLKNIEKEYGKPFDGGEPYTIECETLSGLSLRFEQDYFTTLFDGAAIGASTYTVGLGDFGVLNGSEDITDKLNISILPGNLTVTRRRVELNSGVTLTKEYDGKASFTDGADGLFRSGELAAGHRVAFVTTDGAGKLASISLVDEQGNGVNGCYYITNFSTVAVAANVTPKTIALTTPNVTKEYDGEPLYGSEATASFATPLVYGDRLVTDKESVGLIDVGNVENSPTYKIYNGEGIEVTDLYRVDLDSSVFGRLTITKAALTINLKSYSKEYDGKPFNEDLNGVYEITVSNSKRYVLRFTEGLNLFGDFTETGTSTYALNEGDYKIFSVSDAGKELTAMFDVTVVSGVLKIDKKVISLLSVSLAKTYDGNFAFADTEITAYEFDYALATGHKLFSVSADASANKVLSLSLCNGSGESVMRYYNVSYQSAAVQIDLTKKALYVNTPSIVKNYDGVAAGSDIAYNETDLVSGDRVATTKRVSVVDATGPSGTPNKPEFEIYDANGGTVKRYYDIVANYGTITINKAVLNVTPVQSEFTKIYDGQEFDVGATNFKVNNAAFSVKSFIKVNKIIDVAVDARKEAVAQEQKFESFEFILVSTGARVDAKNIQVNAANSSVNVLVKKRALTVTLGAIYYNPSKVGAGQTLPDYLNTLDLTGLVVVSGLIDGHIEYIGDIQVYVYSADNNRAEASVDISFVRSGGQDIYGVNYVLAYDVTGFVYPV